MGLKAGGECPASTRWPHAHRQCLQLGPNLPILITNATHISMFENKIPHVFIFLPAKNSDAHSFLLIIKQFSISNQVIFF